MTKRTFILSVLLATTTSIMAQQTEQTDFKPKGKPIVRSFFDVTQGLDEAHNATGFDISRAYLGYQQDFSPNWSATLILDAASGNSNGTLQPYLKNAFVQYKNGGFDISLGMTGMLQFQLQESFWQYRYAYKTIQDQNKMGNSADLGLVAKYNLPFASFDITAVNGEGYKKAVRDKSTSLGAGVTITPLKNLSIRGFYGFYNDGGDQHLSVNSSIPDVEYDPQQNLSLFVGYQNGFISGGIEYAAMFNRGFVKDMNVSGFSAFASVKVVEHWKVFARYDNMQSDVSKPELEQYITTDGETLIIGFEYQPLKQFKIAPNVLWTTKDKFLARINFEFNL